jgi:hypothetical protein
MDLIGALSRSDLSAIREYFGAIHDNAARTDACARNKEGMMIRHRVQDVDNRDPEQMYEYFEARIEAMKRRIVELEAENERLNYELFAAVCPDGGRLAASA